MGAGRYHNGADGILINATLTLRPSPNSKPNPNTTHMSNIHCIVLHDQFFFNQNMHMHMPLRYLHVPGNYGLVSLTFICCKIMESIVRQSIISSYR